MRGGLVLAVCFAGCSRDIQLCDARAMHEAGLEGVRVCQALGYDWVDCPDRPRVLAELEAELARCSR